jgi:hypothetical protein
VRKEFPREFQKALLAHNMDYSYLAKAMERRGYRISRQFIGQVALGQRKIPSLQLQRMSEVLGLDQDERRRLHRAACLDMGYEV